MKALKKLFLALIVGALLITPAFADLAYTTVDDGYSTGTLGIVRGSEAPEANVIQSLAGDTAVFYFKDNNGQSRMLQVDHDDYNVELSDTLSLYDITKTGWAAAPIKNWALNYYNVHGAFSEGQYLYLTMYGSYENDKNDSYILKLDMADDYKVVAAVKPEAEAGKSVNFVDAKVYDGKIYALYTRATTGASWMDPTTYYESVLNVYDTDLKLEKSMTLAGIASNGNTALKDGKLYVVSAGGGTLYGDWQKTSCIEEIDLGAWTKSTVTTAEAIAGNDVSWKYTLTGIAFTGDGSLYIEAYWYDPAYKSNAIRVYKTTLDGLKNGKAGEAVVKEDDTPGYSAAMVYDATTGIFWAAAGKNLYKYDGSAWFAYSPTDLGANYYSMAVMPALPSPTASDSGSSGGCNAGAGVLLLLVVLPALVIQRKKR